MLAGEAGEEGVCAVATADEILAVAARSSVDVLVTELQVDEWDVADLVERLRGHAPTRIVAMHRGRRSDHLAEATRLEIDALVSYGARASSLADAVFSRRQRQSRPAVDRRELPGREVLTKREREVLRHVASGLTTASSAERLGVSAKTIDNHKQRIFGKLGVQNQAHAVSVAHRMGILYDAGSLASP
jgi:DNA-binding NarL/FixJ family response regulator